MITALPLQRGRDLYCVPVGDPQRERGWVIGSQVVTITDAVPDHIWISIGKHEYLKHSVSKPLVRLYRDRYPVLMFRSPAEVLPENCTIDRVRYYDQYVHLTQTKRDNPALAGGVNLVKRVKDGRYDRTVITHDVMSWDPLVPALLVLNPQIAAHMPPSLAVTPELIDWVRKRTYLELAREFESRVEGPQ